MFHIPICRKIEIFLISNRTIKMSKKNSKSFIVFTFLSTTLLNCIAANRIDPIEDLESKFTYKKADAKVDLPAYVKKRIPNEVADYLSNNADVFRIKSESGYSIEYEVDGGIQKLECENLKSGLLKCLSEFKIASYNNPIYRITVLSIGGLVSIFSESVAAESLSKQDSSTSISGGSAFLKYFITSNVNTSPEEGFDFIHDVKDRYIVTSCKPNKTPVDRNVDAVFEQYQRSYLYCSYSITASNSQPESKRSAIYSRKSLDGAYVFLKDHKLFIPIPIDPSAEERTKQGVNYLKLYGAGDNIGPVAKKIISFKLSQ